VICRLLKPASIFREFNGSLIAIPPTVSDYARLRLLGSWAKEVSRGYQYAGDRFCFDTADAVFKHA
jgi:hypothetical protein